MPDQVLEYAQDLLNEVGTQAAVDGVFNTAAFVSFVGERLAEAGEFEGVTIAHFDGAGSNRRRLRVDGYDITNSDDSVALLVTDFVSHADLQTVGQSDVTSAFRSLQAYLEDALSGAFLVDREESSDSYQLAYDLKQRGLSVSRFRLFFVTNRILGKRVRSLESQSIQGVPLEYHVWDLERLRQLDQSTQGREPLTIDLTQWAKAGIPALLVSEQGDFSTYLSAVPGMILADLYAAHGSRLLESNVRSYLSNRGKVNKGIRETVYGRPEHFMAFNNGITATATSVEVDPETKAITSVTDLQIVNGGQTTASLFYVAKEKKQQDVLTQVFVQMKLVVVEESTAAALVPAISRYANSQNAVSSADFFSNAPFHVQVESLSRRVLAPAVPGQLYQTKWFYERTRGQYLNEKNKLGKSESLKFEKIYPRGQVLTKTDLAKYEMSWQQVPHVVSSGAQRNFLAFASKIAAGWDKDEDQYNEQYFREVIARAILFNEVRRHVAHADWYEPGGYLANIVTYTVAKLSHMMDRTVGRTMNFDDVWDKQTLPTFFLEFALGVAHDVSRILTSPYREVQNVTEWAKKEKCWLLVKQHEVVPPSEVLEWLEDRTVQTERRRTAKAVQKLDSGIVLQARVYEIDREVWAELKDFVLAMKLGSHADHSILDLAMARQPRPLTESQSARLMKFVAQANSYGFKGISV